MSRLVVSFSILVLALAACGQPEPSSTPSQPAVTTSPSPVESPVTRSASPSDGPSPSPSTPATAESVVTPQPTGTPAVVEVTAEEQALLSGVRRGAIDCHPAREGLPTGAVAGIECAADDPAVARVGFYRFASDEAMLAAYFARMRAEGVKVDTIACIEGEGEAAYMPGDRDIPNREGCFVNSDGYANYRATLGGDHVYIGVLGRSADMRALEDFAWVDNQDVPGRPTLWSELGG